MKPRRYVRLTFTPAGAAKPQTCWAYLAKEPSQPLEGLGMFLYVKVDRMGDETEPTQIIACTMRDHVAHPARMNLFYGCLERTDKPLRVPSWSEVR